MTLIAGFGLSSLACPVISGTFNCTRADGSYETVLISQYITSGATFYVVNGSEINPDGNEYPLTGDPTLINASVRSTCESDSLKSVLSGQYISGASVVGQLTLVREISLVGNKLTETVEQTLMHDEEKNVIKSPVNCTRVSNFTEQNVNASITGRFHR